MEFIEQTIADGTIKIFEGHKVNVLTATPDHTLSAANTEDDKYQFENLEAGQYTYSATATGKGLAVGTFILPTSQMEAQKIFTKVMSAILLTPAVASVEIYLEDGAGTPITADVDRVLVGGIDATKDGVNGAKWVATNVPTSNNIIVEVIPASGAALQNVKETVSISDITYIHTIVVNVPFKIVLNVTDDKTNLINSVANVWIKAPAEADYIPMAKGAGGSFVYDEAVNGAYLFRLEAPNFETKVVPMTLLRQNAPARVVTLPMLPEGTGTGLAKWTIHCEAGIIITYVNPGMQLTDITTTFDPDAPLPPGMEPPAGQEKSGIVFGKTYTIEGIIGNTLGINVRDTQFGTIGSKKLWLVANAPYEYLVTPVVNILGQVNSDSGQGYPIYNGVLTSTKTTYITRHSRLY